MLLSNTGFMLRPSSFSQVSMSLGGPCDGDCSEDSLVIAVEQLVKAHNIVVSVAAGNDGCNACQGSPNAAPSAISVGATDVNDNVAYFSDIGSCIDIFAPGNTLPTPIPITIITAITLLLTHNNHPLTIYPQPYSSPLFTTTTIPSHRLFSVISSRLVSSRVVSCRFCALVGRSVGLAGYQIVSACASVMCGAGVENMYDAPNTNTIPTPTLPLP